MSQTNRTVSERCETVLVSRVGFLLGWVAVALTSVEIVAADDALPSRAEIEFFETKVRPLLARRCYKCHGPQKHKSGLRLDSRRSMLAGGESGPAIVPGKPAESLLVEAINYQSLEMPPGAKLKPGEIAVLTRWVKRGALWPNDSSSPPARGAEFRITKQDRSYWAFQPMGRTLIPKIQPREWAANPIDHFILSRLEERGLWPNPTASKRELIRRVYFDLIGLPPTPDAVEEFVRDSSDDAYERLIDELFSRQQYGERWGRYWLDVVRFAQTNGYERDDEKPFAWRYRDYVIRCFNEDKPYNRFVLEQLAGDELDRVTHDSVIATGFYRLGVWDDEPDDKLVAGYDELDEVIRAIGSSFLGLTVGCARCHNHMFDPLPQEDYYRLLAFIRNVSPYGKNKSETHWELDANGIFTPLADAQQLALWPQQESKLNEQLVELQRKVEELRKPVRDRLFAERLAKLPEQLRKAYEVPAARRTPRQKEGAAETLKQATPRDEDVDKQLDKPAQSQRKQFDVRIKQLRETLQQGPFEKALSVREPGPKPRPTRVLFRGNPRTPGKEVTPGIPVIFGGGEFKPASLPTAGAANGLRRTLADLGVQQTSGRRRALAEWLTAADHPLTARVMVNRLWQHHFGRGIVRTPNDFGRQGILPTHPQLLDWLAAEFVRGGWTLKRMHKLIMMSSTYQMSSRSDDQRSEVDPANDLFWRQNMRRLDAEAIRDALLSISGTLNLQMGGRGIFPALSQDVLATQSRPGSGWDSNDQQERSRRSVYIFVKRTLMVPILETFDYTNTAESLGVRPMTTVAPQALMLLNSRFVYEQATAWADRLVLYAGEDPQNQIEQAFRQALGRRPSENERAVALQLWGGERSPDNRVADVAPKKTALPMLCLLMFNLNEFVYID